MNKTLNHRKSSINFSLTVLMFCLFASGCSSGGGNMSNIGNQNTRSGNTNNESSRTGNQNGAVSPSVPTTSSSPTASPLPLPNALTGANSYVQTAQSVREQIGQRYTYTCPPNVKLYEGVSSNGADVYYTGSSLCSAAIHAGVITQAKGGQITIEIRPAASTSYNTGDERNGVTPRSMGINDQKDNGGFVFIKP